jgi:hypothetical protein
MLFLKCYLESKDFITASPLWHEVISASPRFSPLKNVLTLFFTMNFVNHESLFNHERIKVNVPLLVKAH